MELYPDLCRRLLEIKMLSLTSMPTKFFEYQKGTSDDVSSDTLAFLNYVDSGIVSGKFFEELDAAESNEKARYDFMTLRRGRPIQEIHKDTDLSLDRVQNLAQSTSQENNHAK